eukprot:gene8068-12529_t
MKKVKSQEYILGLNEDEETFGHQKNKILGFVEWIIDIVLFIPNLIYGKRNKYKYQIEKVYHHQKITTGLLEDILVALQQFIDEIGLAFRKLIRCQLLDFFSVLLHSFSYFKPSSFLSEEGIDNRKLGEIIKCLGYGYENFKVETEDEYILSLDRVPNKKSKKVVFFQHGIMDSSFTWVATGQTHSMALKASESGCDVFMGNFRGFAHSLKRKNKKLDKTYWEYSFNEHAFLDLKAFIEKIIELKKQEGVEDIEITGVAHSMGAGSILAYLVNSKLKNQNHGLSRAVLLAPAGVHTKIPFSLKFGAILLKIVKFFKIPIYYLGLTTKTTKVLAAKIFQDVNNHEGLQSLISYLICVLVLGGDVKQNPFQHVHNLVFNTFNGTSAGVLEHFIQMMTTGKFQSFDYGKEKNLEIYGQKEPINFLDNYHLIDIPVEILYSKNDSVIPEDCVLTHYNTLLKSHPDLVKLSEFSKLGHIELTMNQDTAVIDHILDIIKHKESKMELTDRQMLHKFQ